MLQIAQMLCKIEKSSIFCYIYFEKILLVLCYCSLYTCCDFFFFADTPKLLIFNPNFFFKKNGHWSIGTMRMKRKKFRATCQPRNEVKIGHFKVNCIFSLCISSRLPILNRNLKVIRQRLETMTSGIVRP